MSESYDRYGNRLSQSVTAGSAPSSNLSFTANNQPVGYTFDPSGNMTMEPLIPQQNYMTYDGENRMTAVSGNTAASYGYDGNGMRVVKSLQGGMTTVSIYAGSSVIAEYDNGAAPGAPSREYIYNPAGGATTGLLAMISNGATTYYHQDHESVRLVTDANGNVLTQEGTYPFGEPWYTAGQSNKWVFTSYQRDAETGLDYALARYYDSRTGTFCSADPLAGDPSDPQSWNRYPYGRNDPIDMTDPSGQSWLSNAFVGLIDGLTLMAGGPAAMAFFTAEDVMEDAAGIRKGPPAPFSFSFGGTSSGGAWNDSFSVPYGGLANGAQRALGLPTMEDAVSGIIANYTDTVSAYQPGKGTCFLRGAWSAATDFTGLSSLGVGKLQDYRARQFDWHNPTGWGIDYRPDSTAKPEASLFSVFGYANDAVEHGTGLLETFERARYSVWRGAKQAGAHMSWGEFTHTVRVAGKYAEGVSTALALREGFAEYTNCRGN